jgi:hypothetical protein
MGKALGVRKNLVLSTWFLVPGIFNLTSDL